MKKHLLLKSSMLSLLMICTMSFAAHAEWVHGTQGWSYHEMERPQVNTWIEENGKKYYIGQEGIMYTGTHTMDNKFYSFGSDGQLLGTPVPVEIEGLNSSYLQEAIKLIDQYWQYSLDTLELINAERIRLGRSPLILDKDLSNIANYRAVQMNRENYFGHYKDGIAWSDAVSSAYFNSTMSVGENIHMHSSNDENPLLRTMSDTAYIGTKRLVSSPSHYENIVDPAYSRIGIGIYTNSSHTKRFVTQIFH